MGFRIEGSYLKPIFCKFCLAGLVFSSLYGAGGLSRRRAN